MPSPWMEATSTQQAKITAWFLPPARATQVKQLKQQNRSTFRFYKADVLVYLQEIAMAPYTMQSLW